MCNGWLTCIRARYQCSVFKAGSCSPACPPAAVPAAIRPRHVFRTPRPCCGARSHTSVVSRSQKSDAVPACVMFAAAQKIGNCIPADHQWCRVG